MKKKKVPLPLAALRHALVLVLYPIIMQLADTRSVMIAPDARIISADPLAQQKKSFVPKVP